MSIPKDIPQFFNCYMTSIVYVTISLIIGIIINTATVKNGEFFFSYMPSRIVNGD